MKSKKMSIQLAHVAIKVLTVVTCLIAVFAMGAAATMTTSAPAINVIAMGFAFVALVPGVISLFAAAIAIFDTVDIKPSLLFTFGSLFFSTVSIAILNGWIRVVL